MQSIGQIFVEAHRNAVGVLLQRWAAVLVVALCALLTISLNLLTKHYIANAGAQVLIGWLVETGSLWITSPAIVAIYRHLILNEETSASPLHRSNEIETFFMGATLLNLIGTLPSLINIVIPSLVHASAGSIGAHLGALIGVWIALTRLTTYAPGLAVGRPWNSLSVSRKESRGHFWYASLGFALTVAPAFVLLISVGLALNAYAPVASTIALAICATIVSVIGLAATALLYQNLHVDTVAPTLIETRLPGLARPLNRQAGSFGRLTSPPTPFAPTPFATSVPLGANQTLKISPIAVGQAAYGDLFNIVRQMWPVLLLLSALYFVCTMAWFIAPIFVSSWVGRMVMRMLIFVGIAWLATPYYIGLHRFVSTGEVRWLPPRDNYGQSSLIYFAWGALTVMLWFMPQVLGNAIDAFLPNIAGLAILAIIIVVSVLLVRMTTLLPAAALTPERASWAQAMEDSRGRFWRIWLATTGAVLPAIVVLFIIGRAAGSRTIEAAPFFLIAVPALLTLQIVPLAAGTRIYEMLRTPRMPDRMRQVLRA